MPSNFVVLAIIFILVLFLLIIYLIKKGNEEANKWTPTAEGKYDHVEYGMSYYTRRSGAMVHTTSTYSVMMTAIYLEDGRCFVGNGHYDIPYPKGTNVKILKNPFNRLRIEEA